MDADHSLLPECDPQAIEGSDSPAPVMFEHDDADVGPRAHALHRTRFAPYTTSEFGLFPDAECAIEGLLPAQGIACIYGPSGTGKSALHASMIYSLSTGEPWCGREVEPCAVWSVVLEGTSGQRDRMLAIEKHFGRRLPTTAKFVFNDLRLTQPEDVTELADRIGKNGGADVIFIDTLACAMAGGDENSSRDMGLAISGAKALQRATGGLVVLIHHTGKDASRGLRGHSSLNAALDASIEVKRHEDYRSWKLVKSRDSEDGVQGAFLLEPVEVRIDSKGRPVNSIVVVPTDLPDEPERPDAPAHKNQRLALTRLQAYFEVQDAIEDPEMVGLNREEAIEVVKEVMEVGPRHRKLRAAEAIDGLVKGGFLVEIDGQYSLPAHGLDDGQAD